MMEIQIRSLDSIIEAGQAIKDALLVLAHDWGEYDIYDLVTRTDPFMKRFATDRNLTRENLTGPAKELYDLLDAELHRIYYVEGGKKSEQITLIVRS